MRRYLFLSFLLFSFLDVNSQIVGSDIHSKPEPPKPKKEYYTCDGFLLNYECFPGAIFNDASIGLTYYHVRKWGYYGNVMMSTGGMPGKADHYDNLDYYGHDYYIPEKNTYKTAGYILRVGAVYQINKLFAPYLGLGYRNWERNWVLHNGELVTEGGSYQDDVCVEIGSLLRFGSICCSIGIVGYLADTFKHEELVNFKIGIGYEF